MSSAVPRPLAEVLRDEMVMRDRIAAVLGDGPKTIPEIAELLGCTRQRSHPMGDGDAALRQARGTAKAQNGRLLPIRTHEAAFALTRVSW